MAKKRRADEPPRHGAEAFGALLEQSEEQIWTAWQKAHAVQHKGLKGTVRENTVEVFLSAQLPERFRVTRGEAIDKYGSRTGQLDLVIYDAMSVRPLYESEGVSLLPAEALLAVVEVKLKLDATEVGKCIDGAKKVHSLKPHGQGFEPARAEGRGAEDRRARCLTSVFAYETDLAATTWGANEWKRFSSAAKEADCPITAVDRVLLLDCGLLIPPNGRARFREDEGRGVLTDWFFHLANFVTREAARRRPFYWDAYRPEGGTWRQVGQPVPRKSSTRRKEVEPKAGARGQAGQRGGSIRQTPRGARPQGSKRQRRGKRKPT
jgi:hypothetical protein